MSSKPILITGATGFVGRHLVERLLKDDVGLVLAVRDIERGPPHWRDQDRIRVTGMDQAPWREKLRPLTGSGIGTVVHLAGLAHVREGSASVAEALEKTNVELTRQLVEAALDIGVERFVHMSSVAAITSNSSADVVSDAAEGVSDTLYGRTKRAAEAEVRRVAEAGYFAVSLRPPLVVGADAKGNWALLQRLAATGLPLPFASTRNQRSFIGIRSLAEIIVSLCRMPRPAELSGEYCIAHPDWLSLREMVHLLRRGMGQPDRLFACPPGILRLVSSLAGRGRQVAGLTGDLKIDASRFFSKFPDCSPGCIRDEIEESGFEYIRSRRGR